MRYGQNLANSNEQLFIERFAQMNDFTDDLHKGGILGVAQDDNGQDDDNDNDDAYMYEYLDDPHGIPLEPAASLGKIEGVPQIEYTVELPGLDPP